MKQNMLLCALALTLLLGGCASQTGRLEYIGADAAKAIALEAAGATAGQVEFDGTDMETRNGVDYYQVTFTDPATAVQMQYDVDALTGVIIEHRVTAEGTPAASPTSDGQAPEGGQTADAPAPAGQGGQEGSGGGGISEAQARAAALAHAGLTADQVTFVKSGLDWDDGRRHYDVEFYRVEGDVVREYDYDIDPDTGAVLDVDYDAEYYAPPAPTPGRDEGPAPVTPDQAKAIALAKVPGATLDDIREFETDYDDGRLEYEGKIYYDHMEYEFEIDGYSGAIRSWEVESIYDD